LFKTFSDRFSIEFKEVIIHKLVDGVFFSSLICEKDGVEEVIDARTSDAIAIAVRFEAPIFTYENILDKAGVFLKIDDELGLNDPSETHEVSLNTKNLLGVDKESSFSKLSVADLSEELGKAVSDENYELAAKIRDEISKRS
jgi:bifunctional DNase/RNase